MRRLLSKAVVGLKVVTARAAGRRVPLVVGFCLTKRCNYRCVHCDVREQHIPEMGPEDTLRLVRDMARSGVRVLNLTGGEVLLRPDLGSIVRSTVGLGMMVGVNTNGALVPDRIDDLAGISLLKVSLEGPQDAHDAVRGPGAYRKAVIALETARLRGIRGEIAVTVTSAGRSGMGALIDLASDLGVGISIQPALGTRLGSSRENPEACAPRDFRRALRVAMRHKALHPRSPVRMSWSTLRHLASWPEDREARCAGGRVSCRVEPDGEVLHCGRVRAPGTRNALEHGFLEAFLALGRMTCRQCWCAPRLEMNHLYAPRPDAVWHQVSTAVPGPQRRRSGKRADP